MHVETNKKRNILLEVEGAVEGGEGRDGLDWVERRHARAAMGTLDVDGHDEHLVFLGRQAMRK